MQLKKKLNMRIFLVVLVCTIIGIGVYGCKKEEPVRKDTAPKESIEQELSKVNISSKEAVSLEDKLYKQTKIAFTSERDGNAEIYIMNVDGSEQKNLTNNPAHDWFRSWSPDGKKIAFDSYRDGNGNGEIYVMNADGSEQRRLTNNPAHDLGPSWSADGKKIAFESNRDGNFEIYVMNADGSEQRRLTNNPGWDVVPFWSPDGKKIVFHSLRDGNAEIYFMNADGSGQRNLTNNPAFDYEPFWSPDGKKIAFRSNRDGNWKSPNFKQNLEIYIMNADGSEQKRLTNNPAHDWTPSWSPFLPLENNTNKKK